MRASTRAMRQVRAHAMHVSSDGNCASVPTENVPAAGVKHVLVTILDDDFEAEEPSFMELMDFTSDTSDEDAESIDSMVLDLKIWRSAKEHVGFIGPFPWPLKTTPHGHASCAHPLLKEAEQARLEAEKSIDEKLTATIYKRLHMPSLADDVHADKFFMKPSDTSLIGGLRGMVSSAEGGHSSPTLLLEQRQRRGRPSADGSKSKRTNARAAARRRKGKRKEEVAVASAQPPLQARPDRRKIVLFRHFQR